MIEVPLTPRHGDPNNKMSQSQSSEVPVSPSKESRRSRLMMRIHHYWKRERSILFYATLLLLTTFIMTLLYVRSCFLKQETVAEALVPYIHNGKQASLQKIQAGGTTTTSPKFIVKPNTTHKKHNNNASSAGQQQNAEEEASCQEPSKFNIMSQSEVQKTTSFLLPSLQKGDIFQRLLSNLLKVAKQKHNQKLVTFQIGGMDGKSNDPMYKGTQRLQDLSSWIPIVIEPVHTNFINLESTYNEHQQNKNLQCSYLLEQVVGYDNLKDNKEDGGHTCNFCVFDDTKEECVQKSPDWIQTQIGTTTLCNFRLRNPCFKIESYPCGTISMALNDVGLSAGDIAILQLDVEGAEQDILDGFLRETPKRNYPPIIHFEIKVLKSHLFADEQVLNSLKFHGYEIYYTPGDADALAILKEADDTTSQL